MGDVVGQESEHELEPLREPLRLPATPPVPVRPPLPVLAALVPLFGALLLWRLTGSPYALWFAALGPLVALASFLDGLRTVRLARRRARRDGMQALSRLENDVDRRHDEERARAWRRTPDVAGLCADEAEIWRAVPGRGDVLVVGRGDATSTLRIEGEPADEAARALRRRAAIIDDAPVAVPLRDGIAVRGPAALAVAVGRALVLQVCLVHPPGRLRIADAATIGTVLSMPASLPASLPHAESTAGALLVVADAASRLPADADIPVVILADGEPVPPRCASVLTLGEAGQAVLDHGGTTRAVRVEAVSASQAAAIVAALSGRARGLGHRSDGHLTIEDLPVATDDGRGLRTSVGISGEEPVWLDLVADGPHAVVIGTTGSGKSELLTTWVAGMCRGRTVDEVSLLLVDFKGGRAFDALTALPHVTGVVTDLDDREALRAVESLRAEIRRREHVLGEVRARDIEEAAGKLPRLVIVVDEYAALVAAHSELHDLFADIAARGRALGMHLILASQRAAGVFRDGVLANVALRIALRTGDAVDSRTVLGVDDAVRLPGHADARGMALVRRASDGAAQRVRIARSTATAIDAIVAASAPRRAVAPWLSPLPTSVPWHRVAVPGRIVLGIADEPERQRQTPILLPTAASALTVIGAAGSGRSSLLRAIAEQLPIPPVWVPDHPEDAWDAVAALAEAGGRAGAEAGAGVVIDDIDALVGRYPAEYAAELIARLERILRAARPENGIVLVSAARNAGPAARLVELVPQRAILSLATRADHVAAGGEGADFVRDEPPGRGRWNRLLVQFVRPAEPAAPAAGPSMVRSWVPDGEEAAGLIAVVAGPGADRSGIRRVAAASRMSIVPVEEAATDTGGAARIVVGTPEEWLAHWSLLARVRARHELLVGVECAAEFRTLTGRRELPPYMPAQAGRAWRLLPGSPCERVRIAPPPRP